MTCATAEDNWMGDTDDSRASFISGDGSDDDFFNIRWNQRKKRQLTISMPSATTLPRIPNYMYNMSLCDPMHHSQCTTHCTANFASAQRSFVCEQGEALNFSINSSVSRISTKTLLTEFKRMAERFHF